jgi:hypothetical protein
MAASALSVVLLAAAAGRPGRPAQDPWNCPADSPIKGYVSASGARVYFLPDDPFYDEASPERCYADEGEARSDGGRPAREPAAIPTGGDLANSNQWALTAV